MANPKALTHLVTSQVTEARIRAERIVKDVIEINEKLLPPKVEADSGRADKEQPIGWFEETRDSLETLLGTLHIAIIEIKRLTEAVAAEDVKRKA